VEVRSEAEADEAIEAGADIVMLDNMEGGLVSTSRLYALLKIDLQVTSCIPLREASEIDGPARDDF
jgi:nicotinate-nucleotide pyrophosphorylase